MSDFKNMREMIEYCKNGGKVIHKTCTRSEGFNNDGNWSYSDGLEATISSCIYQYSKYIPPKKTKRVKLEAWLDNTGELRWVSKPLCKGWRRVPSEDKEIEIEIGE